MIGILVWWKGSTKVTHSYDSSITIPQKDQTAVTE